MKYMIASAATVAALEAKISSLIADGWRPAGGVAMTGDEYYTNGSGGITGDEQEFTCTKFEYAQAMVK